MRPWSAPDQLGAAQDSRITSCVGIQQTSPSRSSSAGPNAQVLSRICAARGRLGGHILTDRGDAEDLGEHIVVDPDDRERSSGSRSPNRRAAAWTPIAISSDAATTAVGRCAERRSRSASEAAASAVQSEPNTQSRRTGSPACAMDWWKARRRSWGFRTWAAFEGRRRRSQSRRARRRSGVPSRYAWRQHRQSGTKRRPGIGVPIATRGRSKRSINSSSSGGWQAQGNQPIHPLPEQIRSEREALDPRCPLRDRAGGHGGRAAAGSSRSRSRG